MHAALPRNLLLRFGLGVCVFVCVCMCVLPQAPLHPIPVPIPTPLPIFAPMLTPPPPSQPPAFTPIPTNPHPHPPDRAVCTHSDFLNTHRWLQDGMLLYTYWLNTLSVTTRSQISWYATKRCCVVASACVIWPAAFAHLQMCVCVLRIVCMYVRVFCISVCT